MSKVSYYPGSPKSYWTPEDHANMAEAFKDNSTYLPYAPGSPVYNPSSPPYEPTAPISPVYAQESQDDEYEPGEGFYEQESKDALISRIKELEAQVDDLKEYVEELEEKVHEAKTQKRKFVDLTGDGDE